MASLKTILAMVVIFVLASCTGSAQEPTPSMAPATNPPPAAPTVTISAPQDVPVYRNSFEGITDLEARGISSDRATITPNTENFNYPGPGTALQVKGTLPGEAYSGLEANFSIPQLTGETSLDLSNKTLGISFFIPPGSPIANMDVILHKDDKLVILGIASGSGWIDYQLDVKAVFENRSWVFTNASEAEALDMIQHAAKISFQGARTETPGEATEAEFYLDDLNWIGIDIYHIPVDDGVDSLRKYSAGLHFKLGLSGNMYGKVFGGPGETKDPWYAYMLAQEGTLTLTGGSWPMESQDTSNFNYDPQNDAAIINLSNFAIGNSMTTVTYSLAGWFPYDQPPQWWLVLDFPDATRALLLYQVEKDLRFTLGKPSIHVFFNELVQGYNGAAPNTANNWPVGVKNRQNTGPIISGCCYSAWSADLHDSSLVQTAFTKAHGVDPDATLILNGEYNEIMGWKVPDYYYQFAAGLKAQGIPIDGVGFEMHNYITPDGRVMFSMLSWPIQYMYLSLDEYLQRVDSNVKRYASAGLKVAFTEIDGGIKVDDIDLATADGRAEYENRLQWQAKYYAGLLKIAMENDNVIVYNMWDVTEKYPTYNTALYPGYSNSGIFHKNYYPKPAYDALLALLKNQ
jgi:hypothetical protein